MGKKEERIITGSGDMGQLQVQIAEHVLATLMTHHMDASSQQHMDIITKEAYNIFTGKNVKDLNDIDEEVVRQRIKSYYKSLEEWNKENQKVNLQDVPDYNYKTKAATFSSCSCWDNDDIEQKIQQIAAEVCSQQGSTKDGKQDDSAFELQPEQTCVDEQSSADKTERLQNDTCHEENKKSQEDDRNSQKIPPNENRSEHLKREFCKIFSQHGLSYEGTLDNENQDFDRKTEASFFLEEAEQQMLNQNLGLSYQLCREAYFRHPTKKAFEYLQVVQSFFVSSMLQNQQQASSPINVQILKQIDVDEELLKDRVYPFNFSWISLYDNLIKGKFRYNQQKSWEAVTPQLPSFENVKKGCRKTLIAGGIKKVPIVQRSIILYLFTLVMFLWQCFLELSKRVLPVLSKLVFMPPEMTVQIYDCVNDVGLSSFVLRNLSHVILLSIVSYSFYLVSLVVGPFIFIQIKLLGTLVEYIFKILFFGPIDLFCEIFKAVKFCVVILVIQPRWYINVPLSFFLLFFVGQRVSLFWSLPLMFLWGQPWQWSLVNCSLYFASFVVLRSSIVSSVLVLSLRVLWALFSWISLLIMGAILILIHCLLTESAEKQKRYSDGMFNFGFKLGNKPPKGATGEAKRVLSCSDYYSVLEVSRDADEGCIKKAMRSKALLTHPDKLGNVSGAKEAFQRVSEAYEVLGDRLKRKQYDAELLAQEQEQQWQQQNFENGFDESNHDFLIRDSYGFDHIAYRVDVDAKHARYCEQCALNHAAKNGDGWIHERPGFLRGERRVLVCYQGEIFDVTSWAQAEMITVDGYGRQIPANTHKPSLKFQSNKMRGKRKAARRQQANSDSNTRSNKNTSKKSSRKGKRK